ncbi:MAG: hypothetical protein KJP00_12025 [Bacteroidia bacterium]|nr:hypothetical protein [Bacteroidia bacterium]
MYLKFWTIAILSFLFAINANAQCINGVKSYPIYKAGAQLVDKFDNDGLEIVRIEYDLIFSAKESFRNLAPNWDYSIIGFADNGVKDLNMKLYEYDDLLEKWNLVAEDTSTEVNAVVSYKPSVNAMYKVEILVQEFNPGYTAARYGLMYVHE